jgi:hypothetical protein
LKTTANPPGVVLTSREEPVIDKLLALAFDDYCLTVPVSAEAEEAISGRWQTDGWQDGSAHAATGFGQQTWTMLNDDGNVEIVVVVRECLVLS